MYGGKSMDVLRYMAILEIHRKTCPDCKFGDFDHNEIKCRLCKKECPYLPTSYPTETQINQAITTIKMTQEKNRK